MAKEKIFNLIDKLLEEKDLVIIAIDGKSASGKTTFGNLLKEKYDCNIFHMDDFFLPAKLKTKERLDEPGGNVDYIRFKEDVLERLEENIPFSYQIFDCKVQKLTDLIEVKPKDLNIVEGAYSMHPILIDYYDLKVFFDIDDGLQKERIINRNGREKYKKFRDLWIPLENKYHRDLDIRKKADFIFSPSNNLSIFYYQV